MSATPYRLAGGLSRVFYVLRAICLLCLVVLVPATVFAFTYPSTFSPDLSSVSDGQQPFAGIRFLFVSVIMLSAVLVLGNLRGMMRSVVARTPFIQGNVARLRRIAMTMAAVVLFEAVSGLFADTKVHDIYGLKVGHFDFGLFLGMLTVIVLAEVFREGIRFREDSEGAI